MFGAALASAALAPNDKAFPPLEARRKIAEVATCVAKRAPRTTRKIVLSDRGSMWKGDYNFNLIVGDCLPLYGRYTATKLEMPKVLMRFAFAEALLRMERSLTLPALGSVPPLKHGSRRGDVPANEPDTFDVAISALGECVVRTAPGAATALVRSDIASSAESSALAAVTPALSSCLSAGKTFAFSPEVLRGSVALNYYRLAKSAGGIQ